MDRTVYRVYKMREYLTMQLILVHPELLAER